MSKSIQHRGVVAAIDGQRVRVVVSQQSACEGCHAKGVCGEQGKERVIDVKTPYATHFSVGERVVVALLRRSMAFSSVVWAYVLPLVVLMTTLLVLKARAVADGTAAIAAIGAVVLYYVGLYLFRNKIDKKIEFTIIKE